MQSLEGRNEIIIISKIKKMGKNHKEKSVHSNPLTTDVEVASVIHKLRVFAEYRMLMFSLNKHFGFFLENYYFPKRFLL